MTGLREYFHVDAGATPTPPIGHVWSLCVEEHFYWIWPIAVAFLPRKLYRLLPWLCIAATPFVTLLLIDRLGGNIKVPSDSIEGLIWRVTPTQGVGLSVGALLHERDPPWKAIPHQSGGDPHRRRPDFSSVLLRCFPQTGQLHLARAHQTPSGMRWPFCFGASVHQPRSGRVATPRRADQLRYSTFTTCRFMRSWDWRRAPVGLRPGEVLEQYSGLSRPRRLLPLDRVPCN